MAEDQIESNSTPEPSEPILTRVEVVQEEFASNAIIALIPGLGIAGIGAVMLFYQLKQGGLLVALAGVIIFIGIAVAAWGVFQASRAKKVESYKVECPFCNRPNHLTRQPNEDFRCSECNREVPVAEDGTILAVYQVRCGYCNTLNYYSEKSTGLICEECDREIPIATDEETHAKKMFEAYTLKDDNHPYDLILNAAPENEEMIKCLQTMLALNRNQVKDIIEDLPQVLLQGIPKKKAELLMAQISGHKGQADIKISDQ